MYKKIFKRLLDFVLSLIAIIILSPVFLIIAVLIKIKLGSPVIFCQERPGKDEEIFKLYKFRTMTDAKDNDGHLLSDKLRLTKFGKRLRSTSLDEIPELYNILKGDMSIVGPRPLLTEYLPWYNEIEKHRHDVRPGLTGLAQVKGRNSVPWKERLNYDVQYVDTYSFKLDLIIVFKTISKVFKSEGISIDSSDIETNFANERKNLCDSRKGARE